LAAASNSVTVSRTPSTGDDLATPGWTTWILRCEHRDMKLTATIVLSFQARTLADAGATLDDVLERARERDDVDIQRVDLQTPSGGAPVTIPSTAAPPSPPPRVPHPLRT
jgi:hypothetical protein